MHRPVRKVVFPVAGLGTRFLPATKAVPKEMLPIVDRPLIQYAVDEARAAGIEDFIFVNGRNKQAIEDHFDYATEHELSLGEKNKTEEIAQLRSAQPPPGAVSAVRQQRPLGLGHAVWCARHLVGDQPFAVMLPDDLVDAEKGCLAQLIEVYNETGGNVVALEEVPRNQTNRYGIIKPGNDDGKRVEITGMVEKPKPEDAPSNLSIIGRYVLRPEVFGHLERHEKGAGGEIQLTDAMARMIGDMPFHGLRFDGIRYDCGNKSGFLKATVAFALKRDDLKDELMEFLRGCVKG